MQPHITIWDSLYRRRAIPWPRNVSLTPAHRLNPEFQANSN